MLKRNEVELETLGARQLKGIKGKIKLHRVRVLHIWPRSAHNPFIWRDGVTDANDFFNRANEQRILRAYLYGRQNCQIVDSSRHGKTALLQQLKRNASKWLEATIVAYLDLQDSRCRTLSGWLDLTSKQFGWANRVANLDDFTERVEEIITEGARLVLCLDNFEALTLRRTEFTHEFFLALRACGQLGMSIITASREPLSTLVFFDELTSPFYNTFPILRLGSFTSTDAEKFVDSYRPSVPKFMPEEREAILTFAKGHPLALQIACFHVLDAKESLLSLISAIEYAANDMKALLPNGW
jgi:hypothetical protein